MLTIDVIQFLQTCTVDGKQKACDCDSIEQEASYQRSPPVMRNQMSAAYIQCIHDPCICILMALIAADENVCNILMSTSCSYQRGAYAYWQ